MRIVCPTHLILLDLIILTIFCKEYKVMKLLIMQSSPASCHFLYLRSIYSPQHPPLMYVLPLIWGTKFHTHTKQQVKINFCVF